MNNSESYAMLRTDDIFHLLVPRFCEICDKGLRNAGLKIHDLKELCHKFEIIMA